MTIDEKIEILSVFDREIGVGIEKWDEVRLINDVGFPLANLMASGAINELTQVGINHINETFDDLMRVAKIDPTNQDVDSILTSLSNA